VLAARLSEDPSAKVLLLETGSTRPLPAMSVPPAWPELMGSAADWVPEESRHPVARAYAAGLAAIGCPVTDDLSGARQEGGCWPDLAIADGRRVSPADAYLRPALARQNLTVRGGCLATRLIVSRGRCGGVRYLSRGRPANAGATAEVIVCAGAIGAPRLLMLSGIGPAGRLRALGIDPVADLPAVGQNLVDHPVVMVTCAATEPIGGSRYNNGEMNAALRSPHAAGWPDLELFPILLPLAAPGFRPPERGYALSVSVVAPDSGAGDRPRVPARRAARLHPPGGRQPLPPGRHLPPRRRRRRERGPRPRPARPRGRGAARRRRVGAAGDTERSAQRDRAGCRREGGSPHDEVTPVSKETSRWH
jgi:choline dehydrogenase